MLKSAKARIGLRLRRRIAGICLFLAPVILALGLPVLAQQTGGDPMQMLMQQLGNSNSASMLGALQNGGTSSQSLSGDSASVPVAIGPLADLPPSRLEQIISARAGARLQQYGYDTMGRGRVVVIPQAGGVQDDYILGNGDEIIVSLRGQENTEIRATIDRNGQVLLPRLNPIPATGRTFGAFRADIEAAAKRSFIATTAFVSVARVRQITVMVSGEINVPGLRLMPGLASAVDALVLSGGVKKTGSLRNIRIQRAGETMTVDLYGVIADGAVGVNKVQLRDGDRILVPPLNKTVAISGLVRRPGIFELPASASTVSVRALMALGGGPEVRGKYRLSVLRVGLDGSLQMAPLANDNATIGDSEILFVQLGADQTVSSVTLSGGTALAGQYPIVAGTTLADVIKAPGALPASPYTLFGIIARQDQRTMLRSLLAFTPVAVLSGGENQPLQSGDVIRVLSVDEVRLLTNTVSLYKQRQEAEQATIRNPLGESTATGAAAQLRSGGAAARNANATDQQHRDIAELADQIDPVTLQAIDARTRANEQATARVQQEYLQQNPAAQVQKLQQDRAARLQQQQLKQQLEQNQRQYQLQQDQIEQQRLTLGTNSIQGAGLSSDVLDEAAANATLANAPPPPPPPNFQSSDPSSAQVASNHQIASFGDLVRQLNIDQLVLVNFLIDHQVALNGAVGGPGSYFVGPNVPLQDLVQAAGGTTNWADESGVELISTVVDSQAGRSSTRRTQLPLRQGMLASYVVHPGDQLRFNQVFNDAGFGSVTVQGEVRFTGTYKIVRGEHLSDLIARAGGLNSTAYPYGTVFLRQSAAAIERAGYVRAANDIENGLVIGLTASGSNRIDPGTFASLQRFVAELRDTKAVGRVAITADPSVLATKPELDPLLEPGDVLYIPQRPSTITVLGQVMQPGSLPFRSGTSVGDYIQMAGGYGQASDEGNTIVVLPDGTARKVEKSWLGYDTTNLPPGSTVVVSRNLTPFSFRQLITDASSVFSQLAVTAASLAFISR